VFSGFSRHRALHCSESVQGDVKLLVQQANPPSRAAQLPNFVCEILATRRSLIPRGGGKNVEAHHEAVAAGESMWCNWPQTVIGALACNER
jgi:hypothetical protein